MMKRARDIIIVVLWLGGRGWGGRVTETLRDTARKRNKPRLPGQGLKLARGWGWAAPPRRGCARKVRARNRPADSSSPGNGSGTARPKSSDPFRYISVLAVERRKPFSPLTHAAPKS